MALNPLVSLIGRLLARSGRKRGNRQTDGRTERGRNNKTTTVTLAAHACRGLITDRQTVISFVVVVVASKEVLSLFFLNVQLYIAESSLELLARHMIFLSLITEPLEQLGLQGESRNSLHTKFTQYFCLMRHCIGQTHPVPWVFSVYVNVHKLHYVA